MTLRSDYPVFASGFSRSAGDAPLMLDGMEVLFDKTVGLAPVILVPKKEERPEQAVQKPVRVAKRSGNGRRR